MITPKQPSQIIGGTIAISLWSISYILVSTAQSQRQRLTLILGSGTNLILQVIMPQISSFSPENFAISVPISIRKIPHLYFSLATVEEMYEICLSLCVRVRNCSNA